MKPINLIKKAVKYSAAFGYGLFHGQKKQIMFESFNGRTYSDNPRAVSEKMHELFPDFQLIWAFTEPAKAEQRVPDYIHVVSRNSFEFYKTLTESFCYVTNEAILYDTPKRRDQVFIQTWHGDRGFKKILYDAWQDGKRPTPVMDEKLTDLFVVGSEYASERIKTAFRYQGSTLALGCPRNDCLIIPKDINFVREKIGVPEGKKILLYAPTLRKNDIVKSNVNISDTLAHLGIRGGEWVCLVRAHPKSPRLDYDFDENIIDVSRYPDMADLQMIADMLITDYSSCAGDFILKRKPLILAQFDLELYMKEYRTFYMDIQKIGYIIAKSQEELNHLLDTMTDDQFAENCNHILQFYGTKETGHAAEAVCRWIDEKYKKSNKNETLEDRYLDTAK